MSRVSATAWPSTVKVSTGGPAARDTVSANLVRPLEVEVGVDLREHLVLVVLDDLRDRVVPARIESEGVGRRPRRPARDAVPRGSSRRSCGSARPARRRRPARRSSGCSAGSWAASPAPIAPVVELRPSNRVVDDRPAGARVGEVVLEREREPLAVVGAGQPPTAAHCERRKRVSKPEGPQAAVLRSGAALRQAVGVGRRWY